MAAAARGAGQIVREWGGSLEQGLDDVHVPLWVVDPKGIVRWENKRALEVFGDLHERALVESVAPESRQRVLTALSKKVLGTALTTDYEVTVRTATGHWLPGEIHSVALVDGQSLVGVFGVLELTAAPIVPRTTPGLTARQSEVLQHLAEGMSTRQIASALGIAHETVRNHVRAILRALEVHSRVGAIAEAHRRGIIDSGRAPLR